jgi:hypothetical protein
MRGPWQAVRAVHGPGPCERFIGELLQIAVALLTELTAVGGETAGRLDDRGESPVPVQRLRVPAILSSPHRRAGWRSGCSAPSERAEAGQRGSCPSTAVARSASDMSSSCVASLPNAGGAGSAFAAPGAGGCWCCYIADAVARPPALGLSDDAAQQRRDLDAAEAQRLAAVAFSPPPPVRPSQSEGVPLRCPGRRDVSPVRAYETPLLPQVTCAQPCPSSLTSGSFSPQCSSAASTPWSYFRPATSLMNPPNRRARRASRSPPSMTSPPAPLSQAALDACQGSPTRLTRIAETAEAKAAALRDAHDAGRLIAAPSPRQSRLAGWPRRPEDHRRGQPPRSATNASTCAYRYSTTTSATAGTPPPE